MGRPRQQRLKTLTIVCPVYNEDEVILDFHAELAAALRGLAERWHSTVVYVVDRSTDQTVERLRRVATSDPSVRLVLLASRYGQQAALLAGLDHCDSDAVVMMDSDLQHPPSVIPALLDEFEKGKDVVYTVREHGAGIPWPKRVTARLFYGFLNAISETPIHQGAADFRLISRRVLHVFQQQIGERSVFLRGLFNWVGFPSAAVRFRPGRRHAGRSKYSGLRMIDFAAHGVVSFSRTPLRAAVVIGGLLLAGAVLGAAWHLARHAFGSTVPVAAVWLALLLLALCGVQLVFLGVLGEYVGRVLDEVKARPRYLVEERVNFPVGAADDAPAPPGARAQRYRVP